MSQTMPTGMQKIRATGDMLVASAERVPASLYALMMRVAIFMVFWLSARQKVEGVLSVKSSTFFLFEYEYGLPLIPPVWAAYMATYAEHLFSILILIGLATRLSAAALLIMTLVIQIFVYPDAWTVHLMWASILLYLFAKGPGWLSVDRMVYNRTH